MADQVLTKQKLINADEDLGDLEEVLNGPPGKLVKTRLGRQVYTLASVPQINTMTREEVNAVVAPKANKADVDTALSNLSTTANKYYPTLAEANYYSATMAVNDVVTIGEEANKGLWYKATSSATSLTKSPYDPKTQIEGLATVKSKPILANSDLNSYITEGDYRVSGNLPTIDNMPIKERGVLTVKLLSLDANYVIQTYRTESGKTYQRALTDDWILWSKTPTENDLDAVVEYSLAENTKRMKKSFEDNLFLSTFFKEFVAISLVGGSDQIPKISKNVNARSFIIKVDPNISYAVTKSTVTDRFRIAEFSEYPNPESVGTWLSFTDAGGTTNSNGSVTKNISTSSTAQYIVVYCSSTNEDCSISIIDIADGREYLKFNATITSENIIKTVNLFNGKYEDNIWITGAINQTSPLMRSETLRPQSAILTIEPNKTYTISKGYSDRFRIAIGASKPSLTVGVKTIFANDGWGEGTFTFTSGATDRYLVIQVSTDILTMPTWMQIEQGSKATRFENYGFKFNNVPKVPPNFMPVGDALYVDDNDVWYSDSAKTILATDDTDNLQRMINDGVFLLEPNRMYITSKPLVINMTKIKTFVANGATIIGKGDFDVLTIRGALNYPQSANPADILNRAYFEKGFTLFNLKLAPAVKGTCRLLVIEKSIGVKVNNCDIFFAGTGITVRDQNRDLNLTDNHIWGNFWAGIHFEDSCDLHQCNITSNIITYSQRNIWIQNADIYNMQITGNDIELSNYRMLADPIIPFANIHFETSSSVIGSIHLTGNNIEDHSHSQRLIRLEASGTGQLVNINIVGGLLGGSKEYGIEIGSTSDTAVISNITINGVTFNNPNYGVRLIGNVNSLYLGGNSGPARLLEAKGDYKVGILTIGPNNLGGVTVSRIIDVDCRIIRSLTMSGGTYAISGTISANGYISIATTEVNASIDIVNIQGITFAHNDPINHPIITPVLVSGNVKKTMVCNNVTNCDTPSYKVETTGNVVNINNI